MKHSAQQLGQQYRIRTLALLGRLGYASPRQIAKGVWGEVTPSTRKMANRTLSWLKTNGDVVARKRDSVNEERLMALTRAGAARLDYSLPKERPHARDWLRHAHAHRTAANSVFVAAHVLQEEGMEGGCTELEIRSGDVPPERGRFVFSMEGVRQEKIPDVILVPPEQRVWVEVENGYRSAPDFQKCLGFLRTLFWMEVPPFTAVWFVITAPGAKTIGRRLTAALTPEPSLEDARPIQAKARDQRILRDRIRVYALDPEQLELTRIMLPGQVDLTSI